MPVKQFKPGVPRSVHLFAAPFFWTVIGCVLMYRGWGWLDPGRGRLAVVIAGVLGTLKSFLVMDRAARRVVQRIDRFQDGACLGAVYSWKTWLLVLLMMASGITLRRVIEPGPVIGTLYLAIGWALCLSSRIGWRRWLQLRKSHGIA